MVLIAGFNLVCKKTRSKTHDASEVPPGVQVEEAHAALLRFEFSGANIEEALRTHQRREQHTVAARERDRYATLVNRILQ